VRIALVILHADSARGGAERYTIDIARALVGRGHEVSLLAATFAEGFDLPVRQVGLDADGLTRTRRYLRFLDSLDAHLAQAGDGYDIVHAMLPVRRCDVYHPHAGLAAEAMANGHLKHTGLIARLVSRASNRFNPRRRCFARVERQLLSGADAPLVLCLSEHIKSIVGQHFPIKEDRLVKLFNGVDLRRFDPASRPGAGRVLRQQYNISDDRIVALMIAQDYHRKGLRQAILAWARIDDPHLLLVVVGKESPGEFGLLARFYGKPDREVLFAGPTADPCAFYQAADFFVLPTSHDPCSLVVLESLAMGLPVISTAANGACEIMRDGRHGYIIADHANIDALCNQMAKLLDPDLRKQMRANCLALRPELSQEHHVDMLVEAYQRKGCEGKGGGEGRS